MGAGRVYPAICIVSRLFLTPFLPDSRQGVEEVCRCPQSTKVEKEPIFTSQLTYPLFETFFTRNWLCSFTPFSPFTIAGVFSRTSEKFESSSRLSRSRGKEEKEVGCTGRKPLCVTGYPLPEKGPLLLGLKSERSRKEGNRVSRAIFFLLLHTSLPHEKNWIK